MSEAVTFKADYVEKDCTVQFQGRAYESGGGGGGPLAL